VTTTRTVTVKPSGGTYTGLGAAITGELAICPSLVNSDIVLAIECYAMEDVGPVTINSFTTDATRYVKVYTPFAERHSGKWDEAKYRLTSSTATVLSVGIAYMRLDGIQLGLMMTVPGQRRALYWAVNSGLGDGELQMQHCIISQRSGYWLGDGFYNDYLTAGSRTLKAWNNVSDHFDTDFFLNDSGNKFVYNNTGYGSMIGVDRAASAVVNVWNHIYQSPDVASGTGFTGTMSGDYCISNKGDAPGAHSQNATVTFVSTVALDLHLAQADTAARGHGLDMSGDGNLPFSDDIDSQNRVGAWDVGADQFAGGVMVPVFRYDLRFRGI